MILLLIILYISLSIYMLIYTYITVASDKNSAQLLSCTTTLKLLGVLLQNYTVIFSLQVSGVFLTMLGPQKVGKKQIISQLPHTILFIFRGSNLIPCKLGEGRYLSCGLAGELASVRSLLQLCTLFCSLKIPQGIDSSALFFSFKHCTQFCPVSSFIIHG